MEPILDLTISEESAGLRLDKALAGLVGPDSGLSRARLQQLIAAGQVTRDGKPALDGSVKVLAGAVYSIVVPAPTPATPEAQDIPLDIVYEDDDLLVVNKAAGQVVHPAAGHWDGTLVNALLAHCHGALSGIGGVARPGIVHRLDKDTSGLLVVAKNDLAHQKLTAQFADRSLSRVYQAVVWGLPPMEGEVEGPIGRHPKSRQKMAVVPFGGKTALTHYRVIEAFGVLASLVFCKLETGRTHQIRVHMAHVRHPVVGDPMYGTRQRHGMGDAHEKGAVAALESFPRQALHAAEIVFIHPRTGKQVHLTAPMPDDMKKLVAFLKKKTV